MHGCKSISQNPRSSRSYGSQESPNQKPETPQRPDQPFSGFLLLWYHIAHHPCISLCTSLFHSCLSLPDSHHLTLEFICYQFKPHTGSHCLGMTAPGSQGKASDWLSLSQAPVLIPSHSTKGTDTNTSQ